MFPEVAKFTRVCAYDRPGTPVDEKPSRSDPVPQPTTAGDAVTDLDIVTNAQFHELYGEFKEVGMLWRIIERNESPGLTDRKDARWHLLNRACAVEGKNESIMAKLATERRLTDTQLHTLALFRQAVQQLRESIRGDKELAASKRGAEYELFNRLACEVASIVAGKRPLHPPRPGTARANFESITKMRSFDYDAELQKFIETGEIQILARRKPFLKLLLAYMTPRKPAKSGSKR